MHQRARDASVLDQSSEQVHDLRVEDRRHFEVLTGGGRAGKHEDAGADDGADAQRGQAPRTEGLLQPMVGFSESAMSLSIDLRANSCCRRWLWILS